MNRSNILQTTNPASNSMILQPAFHEHFVTTVLQAEYSIDHLMATNGHEKIDILKIDIEGPLSCVESQIREHKFRIRVLRTARIHEEAQSLPGGKINSIIIN